MILPHSQLSNKLWKITWRFRYLGKRNGLEHNVNVQKKAYSRTGEPMARGIHFSPIFFFNFFCPTSVSILWRICVYIHIYDCTETVYELPLLPTIFNNAGEAILHTPGGVRRIDRIRIIRALAWRWLGEYVTFDSTFCSLLSKKEVAVAPVTSKFSSLSHSSRMPWLEI